VSGRSLVIAGAGVAGIEAATAARARDPDARVVVVSGEPWPFYARIRLSEVVGARTEPGKLVLRPPAWYAEQRIEVLGSTRVEGIDPAAGRVAAGGDAIAFDALLLATGSRPFVPPIPGAGLDGVVTLREMEDALAIRDRAGAGGPAVVIGGGLLGLEVAAALAGRGLAVTVVEVASWLLNRQLDPDAASVVQAVLERRGIAFRLGAGVERIAGGGRAEAVDLKGGESLPASLVVVSAGVRPDTALASAAGIAVDRGIRVDDAMRTSAPGVFAAGDCAEHRGRLYGIWPASEAEGRAAGTAMAGSDVAFQGIVPQTTLKIADVLVFSIGEVFRGDPSRTVAVLKGDVYKKVVKDAEGRAIGAILVGDLKERRAVAAAVTGRTPFELPA
jgi:NAD(P)H-nitrite reductase large subunit